MNEYPNTHLFSRDYYFHYMDGGEIKKVVITQGDVNDKYYRYKKNWTNKIIHMPETEVNPPTPF